FKIAKSKTATESSGRVGRSRARLYPDGHEHDGSEHGKHSRRKEQRDNRRHELRNRRDYLVDDGKPRVLSGCENDRAGPGQFAPAGHVDFTSCRVSGPSGRSAASSNPSGLARRPLRTIFPEFVKGSRPWAALAELGVQSSIDLPPEIWLRGWRMGILRS